jgi:hypothetical protein
MNNALYLSDLVRLVVIDMTPAMAGLLAVTR